MSVVIISILMLFLLFFICYIFGLNYSIYCFMYIVFCYIFYISIQRIIDIFLYKKKEEENKKNINMYKKDLEKYLNEGYLIVDKIKNFKINKEKLDKYFDINLLKNIELISTFEKSNILKIYKIFYSNEERFFIVFRKEVNNYE